MFLQKKETIFDSLQPSRSRIRCTAICEGCPTLGNHGCNQTSLLLVFFSEELVKSAAAVSASLAPSGKVGQYLWSASKEEEERERKQWTWKVWALLAVKVSQHLGTYNYGILVDLLYWTRLAKEH